MKTKSLHFLLFIAVILYSTAISAASVARIGTTNYESLSDAIEAARNGQTVTMLADITGNVLVDNQSFSNGESIIVDMSDHTLTGNLHLMINNGTITIKNGTVSGTICGADAENPGTTNYSAAVVLENMVASEVHADGHALKLQGGVYGYLLNSYMPGTEQKNTIILDNPDNYMSTMNIPGDYDRGYIVMKYGHYAQEYISSTISFADNHMFIYSWKKIEKNGQTYPFEIIEQIPEEDNCFMISTPQQLLDFSKVIASYGITAYREGGDGHISKTARILNDIDMEGIEFLPIGLFVDSEDANFGEAYSAYFDGTFDGRGHTISNINVAWNKKFHDAALFGRTASSAIIRNTNLKNVSAYGNTRVAALIGVSYGSKIYNCSLFGKNSFLTSGNSLDGCLIYEAKGDVPTTMQNSYAFGSWLIIEKTTQPEIVNSYCDADVRKMAPTGKLCYLLNNSSSNFVSGGWRQNIDVPGVTADEYPIYGAEGHAIVYYDEESKKFTNTRPLNYNETNTVLLQHGVPYPICQPNALYSNDDIQIYTIGQITPDGVAEIFPISTLEANTPGVIVAKNNDLELPVMNCEGAFKKFNTLWDGSIITINNEANSWTAELVNRNIKEASELSFKIIDPTNMNIVVNVENRDIQRFMSEVDYSNDISSKVNNYVDESRKQDCPQTVCIPLSDSSFYYIENLVPGKKTSFEKVDSNGKVFKGVVNATGTVRMIKVPSNNVVNIRDLGGKTTSYGGKIKYGKLFRNGEIEDGTEADIQVLRNLGIEAEIDLRGCFDNRCNFSGFGFSEEAGNFYYPEIIYADYSSISSEEGLKKFKKALEFVVEHLRTGKAVDFHCVAGADRTGMFASLLCALLGCSMDDIYKEFELTCFSIHRDRTTRVAKDRFVDFINENHKGDNFNEKVEDYYINYAGVAPALIEEFRSLMIEGYNGETDSDNTDISQYDNIVYASNVEVNKGDGNTSSNIVIPINLKNADSDICGIQFDLQLPAGVTVATSSSGGAIVELAGNRATASTHIVKGTTQADGTTRIVCTSFDNKAFKENDGLVLNISANVAATVATGNYSILLKNIVMTNSIPEGYKVAECKSTLTVSDIMLGDVNGDKEVDIIDVAGIVNFVLDKENPNFSRIAADVNCDGNINITDASGAVNIILYGTIAPAQKTLALGECYASASLNIPSISATYSGTIDLPVSLSSIPYDIISLQTDIILPEGVTLAGIKCDEEHIARYLTMPDGSIRIACFSLTNTPFVGNGSEALKFNLEVSETANSGNICLRNTVLTRQNITSVYGEDATAAFHFGETTSIHSANESTENIVRYDLQGRRVHTTTPQKGIYILENGKKSVSK